MNNRSIEEIRRHTASCVERMERGERLPRTAELQLLRDVDAVVSTGHELLQVVMRTLDRRAGRS